MSTPLKAENYADNNIIDTSELDAVVAAGASTFTPKSVVGWSDNDFVIVGREGSEITELRQITDITSGVVTVSPALTYQHEKYAPVKVLAGNQIIFYRAANVDGTAPADASFAQLHTADIQVDDMITSWVDTTGGSDYWYKYTYYNSVTLAETDIAEAEAVRGGGYGHYVGLTEIRNEAGLQNNNFITDGNISVARRDAEAEINASLGGLYTVPFDTAPTPPLVAHITKMLAAGFLLVNPGGSFDGGESKEGLGKISRARGQIRLLQTRQMQILEADGTGLENAHQGAGGWPNDSTADAEDEDAGGERKFTVRQRF